MTLSSKKNRIGTLLFLKTFPVSKNFVSKREISPFSMENLFFKVPRSFVWEPFCVSQNFLYPKELWIKGKGTEALSRCSVEKLLSHSSEKFRRRTLLCCVSGIFQQKIHLWMKGKHQVSTSKNFCLGVEKTFVESSLVFHKL